MLANLRPYWPDDDDQADDGPPRVTIDDTLDRFFDAYLLPVCLTGSAPDTIGRYRETLDHWQRLTPPHVIRDLERRHDIVTAFVQALADQRGKQPGSKMSPATVSTHARNIRFILKHLGPLNDLNPAGADLLQHPPTLPKQQRKQLSKRCAAIECREAFTLDQLAALIDATRHRLKPRIYGGPAALWWEALFRVLYLTGWRAGTAWAFAWDWIARDTIHAPAWAMKNGRPGRFPIGPELAAALELVRHPRRPLVFPWASDDHDKRIKNHKERAGVCQRWLYTLMRKTLVDAGVDPAIGKFHAIRRTTAGQLTETDVGLPGAAAALGHAQPTTTERNYAAGKARAAALRRLPPIPPPPQRAAN